MAAAFVLPLPAQFTAAEAAAADRWESFLREADIVGRSQMGRDQGVNKPWKLFLRQGETVRSALWKNPDGIRAGFLEGWKYEVAAYLLDKALGVNMVPPTVARDFYGYVGSCQLWVEGTSLYRDLLTGGRDQTPFRARSWKRAGYIAQLFDNLIGNQDRHLGNVLVTADFRAVLIDHSRAFRTTRNFVRELPFSAKTVPVAELMRELPRALVNRVRALREADVRRAAGEWLTDEEIQAVMARKRLLVAEIQRVVERFGEKDVLY